MEHGAVLGHVDPVAAEHRLRPLGEAGLLRQLEEEPQCLVGDAVLRVVEVEAGALSREALAARGVIREQIAKVEVADPGVVLLERPPGCALAQRCGCRARSAHAVRAALCASMRESRSFQASTKLFAPSDWSLAASAVDVDSRSRVRREGLLGAAAVHRHRGADVAVVVEGLQRRLGMVLTVNGAARQWT